MTIRFEWDDEKARTNAAKHGIDFEEAQTVFDDALARIHADPDHSESEFRWIITGHSHRGRLLLVSFVEDDEAIRILSARAADRRERNAMKTKSDDDLKDDLRPHYDFDYSKSKPNRYASSQKVYKRTFVALDEDVSKVFQSSEEVNAVLRTAIKAMRTGGSKRTAGKRSSKRKAS